MVVTAGLVGGAGVALAQPVILETRDVKPDWSVTAPRLGSTRGPGYVQVNVGANQANIVGDAGNECSLAVDPRAPLRMVVGWRQFNTIASNFREAGMAWTNDGGRTWHKSTLDAGTFRSDPVVRANADGTIFYHMLWTDTVNTFTEHVARSTDAGRTWSAPAFCYGGDKLWSVIDKTTGPGRGFIYQWWNTAGNNYYPGQFNRSTDGGLTFSSPVALSTQIVFGTMAIGPDGEVYLGGSRVLRSTNASNAAATPTFSTLTATNPLGAGVMIGTSTSPNPAGLLGQVNIAVDTSDGPRRGWVYLLASVPGGGGDPLDVRFSRSTNGGSAWSPFVRVNTDPANANSWQWFGTMSIAPNGRLDVVWNDTSESHNARLSRLYYTSSSDGGVTWAVPQPVTPTWDSWLGWPQQNKIGDYYDMESDNLGADLVFAATLNGEQDVYHMRLGPRDCDRDGIADDAAIAADPGLDCNLNAIPDRCEVAAGTLRDANHDGVPDICSCPGDLDDGAGLGNPDGGTDINDLLYFLAQYEAGNIAADLDDGSGTGTLDGGVDLSDLLFFLVHYEGGC